MDERTFFERHNAYARQIAAYCYTKASSESKSNKYLITFEDIENHYHLRKGTLAFNLGLVQDTIDEIFCYEGVEDANKKGEAIEIILYDDYVINSQK